MEGEACGEDGARDDWVGGWGCGVGDALGENGMVGGGGLID